MAKRSPSLGSLPEARLTKHRRRSSSSPPQAMPVELTRHEAEPRLVSNAPEINVGDGQDAADHAPQNRGLRMSDLKALDMLKQGTVEDPTQVDDAAQNEALAEDPQDSGSDNGSKASDHTIVPPGQTPTDNVDESESEYEDDEPPESTISALTNPTTALFDHKGELSRLDRARQSIERRWGGCPSKVLDFELLPKKWSVAAMKGKPQSIARPIEEWNTNLIMNLAELAKHMDVNAANNALAGRLQTRAAIRQRAERNLPPRMRSQYDFIEAADVHSVVEEFKETGQLPPPTYRPQLPNFDTGSG